MQLGNSNAHNIIYLPTSPLLPTDWHWQRPEAVAALLAANSNHWRKILVLSAKIFSPGPDWRGFLYQQLFQQVQIITEPNALHRPARIQLCCGKKVIERLNLSAAQTVTSATSTALTCLPDNLWLVPYLDYRQFPNLLVEQLRQQLPLSWGSESMLMSSRHGDFPHDGQQKFR